MKIIKVQKNIFKSPTPYNKKTCDACSDKKSVKREAWSVKYNLTYTTHAIIQLLNTFQLIYYSKNSFIN